jgi:predicted transposase YdaD
LRDYEWGLSSARDEGRQEGRREGKLTGNIQLLQQLLGEPISEDQELLDRTPEELENQLALLQQRLRDRQA